MSGYLLIKASANPVSFLTGRDLQYLLDNPKEYAGIERFVAPGDVEPDPDYWPDGVGMLLRYESIIPVPAGNYRLPDDERGGPA